MNGAIWVGLGLLAALGIGMGADAVGSAPGGLSPESGPPAGPAVLPPGQGVPPGAMVEGQADDPEVAALLAELDQYLRNAGIPLDVIDARALTRLPNWSRQAIPPRELWPNIVPTARLFRYLSERMGMPIAARAYRPPDYNRAVGGSPSSTHQWFSAIDVRVPSSRATAELRRELAREGARLYLRHGDAFRLGLGVYGANTPSNIHIDTGQAMRTWADARAWIRKVEA